LRDLGRRFFLIFLFLPKFDQTDTVAGGAAQIQSHPPFSGGRDASGQDRRS
jgi:hypothetical protein